MTEAEWLAGSEPGPMLDHLGDQASDRKLRLFACAVGRRHEAQVGTARFREVLELAERYADGEITGDEMTAWAGGAVTAGRNRVEDHARAVAYWITRPGESMRTAARVAIQGFSARKPSILRGRTRLLRCLFGNPFKPVAFDPRWRTADVLGLARGIYEDRAFDRLPLLGDALMDAGCADEQVLGHCRSEGPHVRGCWVVDSVLGKE